MNFTTIFAASCVTLSVSIVGGLYFASKVERRIEFDGASGSASARLWITTPPFTLIGVDGKRHTVTAVVSTNGKKEANRFCRYMPIVRDRLQRFAAAVRVTGIEEGQPVLRGDKASLAGDLVDAVGLRGTPRIEIFDGNYPIQRVTRKTPATCEGGRLAA
ncbi:hypothetical protein EOI86_12475 [Hwanghaeella grinnelliae]|uniref:Uncharacterized protein n=1 Tax=Hwanghaeella grinnelliae TaxID=2500179 RepID=A0A437QNP1_9PROT|nr:hypothetical protein [Hwanghaeella grinnelliae]RVU36049.1 hypothetical protein EOI86_12475 [Hwanghaeella grinnelliae]